MLAIRDRCNVIRDQCKNYQVSEHEDQNKIYAEKRENSLFNIEYDFRIFCQISVCLIKCKKYWLTIHRFRKPEPTAGGYEDGTSCVKTQKSRYKIDETLICAQSLLNDLTNWAVL
jgi:hypothetical protein